MFTEEEIGTRVACATRDKVWVTGPGGETEGEGLRSLQDSIRSAESQEPAATAADRRFTRIRPTTGQWSWVRIGNR